MENKLGVRLGTRAGARWEGALDSSLAWTGGLFLPSAENRWGSCASPAAASQNGRRRRALAWRRVEWVTLGGTVESRREVKRRSRGCGAAWKLTGFNPSVDWRRLTFWKLTAVNVDVEARRFTKRQPTRVDPRVRAHKFPLWKPEASNPRRSRRVSFHPRRSRPTSFHSGSQLREAAPSPAWSPRDTGDLRLDPRADARLLSCAKAPAAFRRENAKILPVHEKQTAMAGAIARQLRNGGP